MHVPQLTIASSILFLSSVYNLQGVSSCQVGKNEALTACSWRLWCSGALESMDLQSFDIDAAYQKHVCWGWVLWFMNQDIHHAFAKIKAAAGWTLTPLLVSQQRILLSKQDQVYIAMVSTKYLSTWQPTIPKSSAASSGIHEQVTSQLARWAGC